VACVALCNIVGGTVSERPKVQLSKSCVGESPPWVQIPPVPLRLLRSWCMIVIMWGRYAGSFSLRYENRPDPIRQRYYARIVKVAKKVGLDDCNFLFLRRNFGSNDAFSTFQLVASTNTGCKSALAILDDSNEGFSHKDYREMLGSPLSQQLITESLFVANQNVVPKPKNSDYGFLFFNFQIWKSAGIIRRAQPRINLEFRDPQRFCFLNGKLRPHRLVALAALQDKDLLRFAAWSNRGIEVRREAVQPKEVAKEFPLFEKQILNGDFSRRELDLTNTRKPNLWDIPQEATRCGFWLISETEFSEHSIRVTEKTLKALIYGFPFLVLGPPGLLRHLRQLGFLTYSDVFDETYDDVSDHQIRLAMVLEQVENLLRNPLSASQNKHIREITRKNQRALRAHVPRILSKVEERVMAEEFAAAMQK
jgi:hypothetical protein